MQLREARNAKKAPSTTVISIDSVMPVGGGTKTDGIETELENGQD